MTNKERIEALTAEIEAMQKADRDEREARRKAFKPEWNFKIVRTDMTRTFTRIYDDNVIAYTLVGQLQNLEAAQEAGYTNRGGSMIYLFNEATGRIIKSDGGGTCWLVGEMSSNWKASDQLVATLHELNRFLLKNSDGGDVTDIVTGQPGFGKQWQ
jgi:hypothetical protein